MEVSKPRYRLGVDVGGTHTDLVLLDAVSGKLMVEKVSSTPHNPALGVLNGVAKFVARGVDPDAIEFFAHGTTITTNALLEMRGSKVGMLITRGYRAVQEIQLQARDGNLFDYFYSKPAPIAPQSLTYEIGERSDYQGSVLKPLDRESVRAAARRRPRSPPAGTPRNPAQHVILGPQCASLMSRAKWVSLHQGLDHTSVGRTRTMWPSISTVSIPHFGRP